jgi:small-conductance mechanosensitive channel
MPLFRLLQDDPFVFLVPVALLLGTVLAGLVFRAILFRLVANWADSSDSNLGTLIIATLRGPIILWSLILGLHIATQNSRIPSRYLEHHIPTALAILWIWSLTIAASRFAGNAVRFYGGSVAGLKEVTSLTQKLVQIVIVGIGLVILLKVAFNLSLTPVLTTLGVGGLAVALALQDTLANLFAGFYVSISGLIRIGDYIKLNSGEEGFVTDINWRCTTLRPGTNNLVVVPNSKLGQATFTNYHLPDSTVGTNVNIGVSGEADFERVEAILLEEARRACQEVAGIKPDAAPSVLYQQGIGQFQIGFSVTDYANLGNMQSEMRKRAYRRLKAEKIPLPRLVRTFAVDNAK